VRRDRGEREPVDGVAHRQHDRRAHRRELPAAAGEHAGERELRRARVNSQFTMKMVKRGGAVPV
jgi:hypothetical protein